MSPQLNPDAEKANSGALAELSQLRPYLRMLARMQLNELLQAKLDDSDIVQQTLFEAHRSLPNFRGKSKEEQLAWLKQILVRNIADELRKFHRGKRDVRLETSLEQSLNESTSRIERFLACEHSSPSQHAMANEQLLSLASALMKLPEDQRRAVELYHLQGYPAVEVAKRLDRTEVAVAGLVRRGINKLRELMRNET